MVRAGRRSGRSERSAAVYRQAIHRRDRPLAALGQPWNPLNHLDVSRWLQRAWLQPVPSAIGATGPRGQHDLRGRSGSAVQPRAGVRGGLPSSRSGHSSATPCHTACTAAPTRRSEHKSTAALRLQPMRPPLGQLARCSTPCRHHRSPVDPHPYPRPSGAGKSSPPDGLGSQAMLCLAPRP